MMRLLGALLVAGACTWLGFDQAARLKRRAAVLEEVKSSFALLTQQLELGSPLPRLLEDLALKTAGPTQELFACCARELNSADREDFSRLWRRGVEGCPELDRETKNCLLPLGETLGQCALEDQKRRITAVLEALNELHHRAQADFLRQGRVYRMLGLSGGSFLVILLL